MKFCRESLCSSHWGTHQRPITTATDRRMNPSCQVRFSFIFKIRAPAMEPMTDRCICDGRSSGLIVSLTSNPTRLDWEIFKSFQPFKLPTPSLKPFISLFLPFPPFLTSCLSHPLLYQLIHVTSPNPTISFLVVGVCCCGSILDSWVSHLLVFLLFSCMCLWSLPIYTAFLFFNYYWPIFFGGSFLFDQILSDLGWESLELPC